MCTKNKIVRVFLFCSVLNLSVSCSVPDRRTTLREKKTHRSASALNAAVASEMQARRRAVRDYVGTMPLEEQVCQLFIENLEGNETYVPAEWTVRTTGRRRALVPGGYLFFSYNIADSPEKIIKFTGSINEYCASRGMIPPYLALDQEGGSVSRLRGIAGPLPSCEKVAAVLSASDAYRLYSLQAQQMRALGFTMNLAPVAEVCSEENRKFLAERSFGTSSAVIRYGTAAVNAFQNNGIAAVLKHFPGNTNTDPHSGLPEITLSQEQIASDVMVPFKRLVSREPAGVLMSHARTSSLDPMTPACLSSAWVTGMLRGEADFQGLIFSDDIFMSALAGNGYPPDTAAVRAVEAGVDVIMISEKRFSGPASVLVAHAQKDPAFARKIRNAVERVILFKIQYGLLRLQKEGADWRVTVPSVQNGSADNGISARLTEFTAAREENTSLYGQYFTAGGTIHASE